MEVRWPLGTGLGVTLANLEGEKRSEYREQTSGTAENANIQLPE